MKADIINTSFYNNLYNLMLSNYLNCYKLMFEVPFEKWLPEWYDKALHYKKCIEQKTIYPVFKFNSRDEKFLKLKLAYYHKIPDYERYFIEMKLKYHSHTPCLKESEYFKYLELKSNYLTKNYEKTLNKIKKIDLKYELIITNIEMEEIIITKKESDKIIDEKIKNFRKVIDIIKRQIEAYETRNNSEKDKLERALRDEKIIKKKVELEAKINFLKAYEKRKYAYEKSSQHR